MSAGFSVSDKGEIGATATVKAAARGSQKASGAFRTIGEVADDLDLPAHVLRFWESKFPQLKPLKRAGGRRYYRPEDIALLRRIRQCLYQDGYTIRGVRQLLGDEAEVSGEAAAAPSAAMPTLFPLEPVVRPPAAAPALTASSDDGAVPPPAPPKAPRRPPRQDRRRRPPSPETQAALEDIRRELLAARALIDDLLRRGKPS
ncbi:MAG: MerR family transcriptional regulator [Thiohalocapsa sp.]